MASLARFAQRSSFKTVASPAAIRLCHGAAHRPDPEFDKKIEAATEHHRRLAQTTSQSLLILYCRDEYSNFMQKWLRSFSIDISCDFPRWRKHQSPWRNLKLWTPKNIVRSDNIRRLLYPDLTASFVISGGVCYYNLVVTKWLESDMVHLPLECLSLTSVALGLLVTFKTQMSYARFIEGRNLWGLMINDTRAMASRIMARVPGHGGDVDNPIVANGQRHAVKLIRTLPFTLKYHLTEDGCNPHILIRKESSDPQVQKSQEAELKEALSIALRAELHQIWNVSDDAERAFVERIMAPDAGNRPLHVLHEIGLINAEVFAHPNLGGLDHMAATEMDRSLTTFQNVLGACEKILRTPIYSSYSKFTCRFLTLWCTSLPFALYPLLGLATLPASMTITFFMLGIEDIGCRVEQPFNVMPLWQYCQTIDTSCVQIVKATEAHMKRQQQYVDVHELGDSNEDEWGDIPAEALMSFSDPLENFKNIR